MPAPVDVLGVRSFIGLAGYYRKLVPNFSNLAKHLNELTQARTPFVWNAGREEVFQKLNTPLTGNPVLRSPDSKRPFELHTDTAKTGLGAVLSQRDDDKNECVISYAIRSNNEAEGDYSNYEGEALAVV